MATNKFLIFDEQGRDMMTDTEYSTASQRISGVIPGLADAEMHNKLYRQVSIMANAIGRVLAEAGLDAPDTDAATLAANIKSLFVSKALDAYPVGAIYISVSGTSPATLFGGTWAEISGRFLLAANGTYTAGTTGGEASHTLTTNEMPRHTHSVSSVSNEGTHSHTGTAASNGAHTHTRGSMNITGTFSGVGQAYSNLPATLTGALYRVNNADAPAEGVKIENGGARDDYFGFDASRNWTGATSSNGAHTHTVSTVDAGAHTHSVTNANTGGGAAHNNMPPYLAVYVWKRMA